MAVYLSDSVKNEISYFKRLHENFSFKLNGHNDPLTVASADDSMIFKLMSASLVSGLFEEALFENLVITDGKDTRYKEFQLDAYAFVDTDERNRKRLHLFQYKFTAVQDNFQDGVCCLNSASV